MAPAISALKAELIGAENEYNKAIADREQFENKLVEIPRFDDGIDGTVEYSGKRDEVSPEIRRDSGVSDLIRFLEYRDPIETERHTRVDHMSRILFLEDNECAVTLRIWSTGKIHPLWQRCSRSSSHHS
jgi:hypothetical protein